MWGGLCLCWTILYAVCSSPHRPGLHFLLFTPHAIHSCMWPALLPLQVVSLHSILYFVTFLCTIYSPPPAGWACTWQGHSLDCTPFIPVRFLPSSTRFRLTPEHSVFLLEWVTLGGNRTLPSNLIAWKENRVNPVYWDQPTLGSSLLQMCFSVWCWGG